ncbi:MAG: HDIG domain-containing protein [Defluviitaleaceae bacterium]|nr:HDIG domain-containing protein [Defluviitaleaceae bacterium]
MRSSFVKAIFIFAAFLITCAAVATGSYFNAGLIVEVDEPSEIRIRAPRDTENIAETQRNRDAARVLSEGLDLVFTVDEGEWATVQHNLSLLRAGLENIRYEYVRERADFEAATVQFETDLQDYEELRERLIANWQTDADAALEAGEPVPPAPTIDIAPQPPEWEGLAFFLFADLPIVFNEMHQEFIVDMTGENFAEMWEALESAANTVQTTSVIHQYVDAMTELTVRGALLPHALDRTTDGLAERIVLSSLRTNAVPNVELNEQRRAEVENDYERVMFYEGDTIVDEGEIVTQEIYDILAHLDMLAPESFLDNIYPMLGVFFLVAVLFLAGLMYMAFYRKPPDMREPMLLFTLYTLTIILVWTLSDFSFPFLPILIFPMLVSILIDRRCGVALTFPLILICFFIVDGDMTYLLFYSAAGMLFCMFSRYTTERGKSVWVGLLISVIMFALAVAVLIATQRNEVLVEEGPTWLFIRAGLAAASGILTVFLCMGSLPLWETFFGVVTPIKLLDLANPQNLLLRRLTNEAPGTFHHSLIVANLAETAAYDIGANAHAARVGGYYHDVGKLKYPHFFVENLDGENPHDLLEPASSANIIMSHVSYGLTLATEHRLPPFVRDIIKEHHGTTLLQYFYTKSCERARETGEELEEKDFRYPFTIPQTRESACVMLADSVEAAVRSMIPKMKSVDEVEKTIRTIIRGKLNDDQLAESQLSIHDIAVIEQSFFRVLKGMYHERIAYPTAKAAEKKKLTPGDEPR